MLIKLKQAKGLCLLRELFQMSALSCALISAPLIIAPSLSHAQNEAFTEQRQYTIPAGPLDRVLSDFIQISGLLISSTAELTKDQKSPGLQGNYAPIAGLNEILLGTNIGYNIEDNNSVTLVTQSNKSESASLDTIRVLGTAAQRYQTTSSTSATGIEVDLIDTPRAIQVIPEQLILDQQSLEVEDVLRNVSGVQPFRVVGGTGDSFLLRGFRVNNFYQDGFRLSQEGRRLQTANIEVIEVVKGATALLYGQTDPGGVINLVSKKPENKPRHYISSTFDDEGKQYWLADFTGPLNESGTLTYRLVGSYEDSDTFRESSREANVSRENFAPSLTWQATPADTLTFSFERASGEAPIDRGTAVVQNSDGERSLANVPRDRRFGEDRDTLDSTQENFRLHYEHLFENDWAFETIVNYEKNDANSYQNNPTAGISSLTPGLSPIGSILAGSTLNFSGVEENGLLVRSISEGENTDRNVFAALRLSGEFDLFEQNHNFTTGIDYSRRKSKFASGLNLISAAETGIPLPPAFADYLFINFNTLNIFDPEYNNNRSETTPTSVVENIDEQQGIYIQDLITINDYWLAQIGLRYDRFNREIDRSSTATSQLSGLAFEPGASSFKQKTNTEDEFSPNAGITFKPNDKIAFYASYSESFTPNIQNNNISGVVENNDPSEGLQYELGIKGSLLDERVNFGIALYDLTLDNVLNGTDPLTGEGQFNGEQNSRGLEIDSSVQFLNGLNMVFSYAYTDAEITESRFNKGNEPQGVAEHSASLWTSYEFQGGQLNGLGIGGGAFYVSDRYADGANTVELDDFTLFDLTTWYHVPLTNSSQLRIQAGVKNLTDEEYYVPGTNNFRIGVGQPRTTFISLAVDF